MKFYDLFQIYIFCSNETCMLSNRYDHIPRLLYRGTDLWARQYAKKALDIMEILPRFYPTCSIYSPFSITQGEPEAARICYL